MTKKHTHSKDPVHYPNVALGYENKFKRNYELMLKNMNKQMAEKIKQIMKNK